MVSADSPTEWGVEPRKDCNAELGVDGRDGPAISLDHLTGAQPRVAAESLLP